jgi:hypothetical protein
MMKSIRRPFAQERKFLLSNCSGIAEKSLSFRQYKSSKRSSDALRAEYDFSKGVRGKHAEQYAAGTNVVVIEPDIAAEFPTAKDVTETLRAVAQLLQRRRGDRTHELKNSPGLRQ